MISTGMPRDTVQFHSNTYVATRSPLQGVKAGSNGRNLRLEPIQCLRFRWVLMS